MTRTYKHYKEILYMTTLFFWFSQSSYLSYIGPTLRTMDATATLIGMVGGVYGFVQMACRIPMGIAADKYNLQKLYIILGGALAAASGLGIFVTFSPMGFLIFRALAGLASSTWVCFSVTYAGYFEESESPRAMSMLNSANYTGKLAGLLLVGLIANTFGTRMVFIAAFLAGVICFILSLFVKPARPSAHPLTVGELLGVMKNKNLLVTSCFALVVQFVNFATTYQFSPIMARRLGAGDFTLAAANMVTTAVLIIATVSAGKFLLKMFSARTLLMFGLACLSIYCFGVGLADKLYILFILQAFAGMGEGLCVSILMGLCIKEIEPEKKSTAMGVFSAIYGLGMTVGPIFMGILIDSFGYTPAFMVIGIIAAVTFLLVRPGIE